MKIEKFKYTKDNLEKLIMILLKSFGYDEIRRQIGLVEFIDSVKECKGKYFKFVKLGNSYVGCYEYDNSTGVLASFGILPEYQLMGIGKRVIENLLGEINRNVIDIVYKPNIIEFYQSFPMGTFYYTNERGMIEYI